MAWKTPNGWTPQLAGFLFAVVFIVIWVISESFFISLFVAAIALLRVPGLWTMLRGKAGAATPYRRGRFDPDANEPDAAALLERMPRYAEGRTDPAEDPTPADRPARVYEEDDAVAATPEHAATMFGDGRMPPRKPVQLPRHRP